MSLLDLGIKRSKSGSAYYFPRVTHRSTYRPSARIDFKTISGKEREGKEGEGEREKEGERERKKV